MKRHDQTISIPVLGLNNADDDSDDDDDFGLCCNLSELVVSIANF